MVMKNSQFSFSADNGHVTALSPVLHLKDYAYEVFAELMGNPVMSERFADQEENSCSSTAGSMH
jgi:hypothetical protein